MANSAADARGSELDIRKALIETRHSRLHRLGRAEFLLHRHPALHAVVSRQGQGEDRRARSQILFIDARHVFRQIDRAHRDFTPAQIEFLANIVRLWRGEPTELLHNSYALLDERGLTKAYVDVPGLCKAASLAEIEAQGFSLNPGRYVGATAREADGGGFSGEAGGIAGRVRAADGGGAGVRGPNRR